MPAHHAHRPAQPPARSLLTRLRPRDSRRVPARQVHCGEPPRSLPAEESAEGLVGVAGAVWDLWLPQDAPRLSAFLKVRAAMLSP